MADALLPLDVWHLVASHLPRLAPLVPLLPALDWQRLAAVRVQQAWKHRPRITHVGQRVALRRKEEREGKQEGRWRHGTVVEVGDLPLVLMDSRFTPNHRYVFVCRRTYHLRTPPPTS